MDISVLGRIGYDLCAEQRGIPLKNVESFSRHLGGSSANLAVGLSRLGLDVGIIAAVGQDSLGEFLLEYLEKEGVRTHLVQEIAGAQSSLCLTEISPPESFPQVFYRERAADTLLEIGEDEQEAVGGARLFVTNGTSLCASPSRESTFKALEWARRAGVRTALDVDYRAMSWPSPDEAGLSVRLALPTVDVLIANPEELELVSEETDPEEAMQRILDLGPSVVVAKLGPQGTRLRSRDRSLFHAPYPVKVVSTIGAGDGFAAGFLYALAMGQDLAESLRYGNASAAIVVSRLMCADAMPTLTEIQALLEENPDVELTES